MAGTVTYPGFGTNRLTSTKYPPKTPMQASEDRMRSLAGDIQSTEEQRYASGLGTATDAYNTSRSALSSLIDPSLLFSQASDAIGARSIQSMNGLRTSLGARG